MNEPPASPTNPWVRRVAIFLAISYGIGAPVGSFIEARYGLLSERFGYPPAFLHLVGLVQFVCAFGVLRPRFARLAASVLTLTTLGAIASHFRIGSPQTSVGAIAFTALQIWFAFASPRRDAASAAAAR